MFTLDPIVLQLVFLSSAAVLALFVLHHLKQPSPVAYIVTGVLLGPYVLGLVTDQHLLERLGELGLSLLLFFLGTEVSLSRFAKNWRIVLVGTLLQVCFSVALLGLLGLLFDWSLERTVLLGFIVSLSSTAVVLKYLEEHNLLSSKLGTEVTGILIMQDILLVPMLLIVSWLGGTPEAGIRWPYQLLGLVFLGGLVAFVLRRSGTVSPHWLLPFKNNREFQLFLALLVCFGLALVSGFLGLSVGLGAFAGGIIVAHLGGVVWVRRQLHAFHTFFMALFFVSIGMLINLTFFRENVFLVVSLVLLVLVANTLINAFIFRAYGETWGYSLYAGALLAQIGELSFLLAAVGLSVGAFVRDGYQLAVLVISLTLLLSPLWIGLVSRLAKVAHTRVGM